VSVYDRGVDLVHQAVTTTPDRTDATISYRLGDTWAPALPEREPLAAMVAEFAASIHERRPARTDGAAGLRVLSVLEAAQHSLAVGGSNVDVALTGALEVVA
jgi:hypothetical protein